MRNNAWKWATWRRISKEALYEALRLRQDIFVLEQACAYPELDGYDLEAAHLIVRDGKGRIRGYLRVLPPGVRYEAPSIGRLVVRKDARGKGLGRKMMLEAISRCRRRWPKQTIRIQAQQYLEGFYASLGFETISEPYDEDRIMHVDMVLRTDSKNTRGQGRKRRTK